MSGLCGWIGYSATNADNRQLIEKMAEPVVRFDGGEALTLTKSTAAMAIAADDRHVFSYQNNGVVAALWGQVRYQGKPPRDFDRIGGIAKVLADGCQSKGGSIFADLEGEFIFCMLNEDTGVAILTVDRMCTRSLSYQVSGETLIFSTSADAIIKHPLANSEISSQSLFNYIYFHMVPSPDSIYKDQQRLLPGQYLTFKKGEVKLGLYWKAAFDKIEKRPFNELKLQLRDMLRSSVREAAGGQEVGAFLSGGTDSSTIAGVLGEVTGQPARTYSIGFEAKGYDEMEYARIAAKHFSTQHNEYYVTPDDVVAAIPEIAAVFDQPFGNASAIPAFYCARMAKTDGLTRILGGDGGDELFGGNERYAKQHLLSYYKHLPLVLRKRLLEPIAFGIAGSEKLALMRKARSYIEQAMTPMPARMVNYNLLRRYGYETVFTQDFLATIDLARPSELLGEAYHQAQTESMINNMLAFDFKITLADNDLPKVVKACELAGMSVGFPLISNEMVEFSTRLEPQLKLKGTKLRYFFKESLRGFLPDEVLAKQKHGFGLPFGVWLHENQLLKSMAADSLVDLKARQIVRADFIDQLLDQYLKEHASYHGTMIWILMMLEYWFKLRAN